MNDSTERVTLWGTLRTTFGRGVVVLMPVVITVWFLNVLFSAIDGIISPIFVRLMGRLAPMAKHLATF